MTMTVAQSVTMSGNRRYKTVTEALRMLASEGFQVPNVHLDSSEVRATTVHSNFTSSP